jgi:hypothetical protein
MGKILPSTKKAIIDEILDNISSNTSYYYAFGANPIPYPSTAPAVSNSDYQTLFVNNWQMMFGKKLLPSNFAPMVKNNQWVSNTVYDMYDNTDENLHSNNNFYVIADPDYIGGSYNFYKCIDNANGALSTIKPNLVKSTTFETSDGYKWRYITSVTYRQHKLFSTDNYVPVYANSIIAKYSNNYAGIDVVKIVNAGSGYIAYNSGTVRSANSTVIQIENSAVDQNQYYTNSAIYIYNNASPTAQLFGISQYVSNTIGRWVYLDGEANTDNILPDSTQYTISPKVVFTTDANTHPRAYSVVNNSTNAISQIVMIDSGNDITWANVHLETNFGSGANLYALVPPPGGHGRDAISELNVMGLGVSFNFSNTENSVLPVANVVYNKVGIIKNPYILVDGTSKSNTQYTSNAYNQLCKLSLVSPVLFTVGDTVRATNTAVLGGEPSGAVGTVAFANTTEVHLTGDKYFVNGDIIVSNNGSVYSEVTVLSRGEIYTKDLTPLYVQNINNVNRSNTQTESFKLIIQL